MQQKSPSYQYQLYCCVCIIPVLVRERDDVSQNGAARRTTACTKAKILARQRCGTQEHSSCANSSDRGVELRVRCGRVSSKVTFGTQITEMADIVCSMTAVYCRIPKKISCARTEPLPSPINAQIATECVAKVPFDNFLSSLKQILFVIPSCVPRAL